MQELLRTNDPVLLSFAEVVLRQLGIECLIADQHMSVIEGSIGAFPRRILVEASDWAAGRRVLQDAGLGQWLYEPDGRARQTAMGDATP